MCVCVCVCVKWLMQADMAAESHTSCMAAQAKHLSPLCLPPLSLSLSLTHNLSLSLSLSLRERLSLYTCCWSSKLDTAHEYVSFYSTNSVSPVVFLYPPPFFLSIIHAFLYPFSEVTNYFTFVHIRFWNKSYTQ